MTARCVMVLGTTSGAGKSWLATALCRHYARQGLKVAPFKAQNMSNNARIVAPTLPHFVSSLPPEGANFSRGGPSINWPGCGEIGSAQYFQALAARAEPDVRMNPLLLKPERDTRSQVVLMGQVDEALSNMPWRGRSELVWPAVRQALDELMADNDVVVIEGAGSPAEINLASSDIVNMRVALHARANCLLVTDIDRGGAFAHLFGTWSLLPEAERQLIKGFVLNKFRGDASLLAPAPQMLQDLTGVPTVAVLPMWREHGLPEEDGWMGTGPHAAPLRGNLLTIAIVAYPRISNLDEFQALAQVPGVQLHWVRQASEWPALAHGDWVVLPGSKHTSGDLAWLRAQGLDARIAAHAAQGGAVLGICGGLQMLGEALVDHHGIDGNAPGLGLLPLVTVFEPEKTVKRTSSAFAADLHGAWAPLAGLVVSGYEIHQGQTTWHPAFAAETAKSALPNGLAWQGAAHGTGSNVLGIYLHGLFEDAGVLKALFGAVAPSLDAVFDGLADFAERHFDKGVLADLLQKI